MRRVALLPPLLFCSILLAQSDAPKASDARPPSSAEPPKALLEKPLGEPKPELDALHRVNDSIQSLAARVSPCVVKILVTGYGPVSESNRMETALIGRQRSIGSGVILDASGYIVTNSHVVNGAQRVRVAMYPAIHSQSLLSLGSGPRARIVDAKIIGIDKVTDLAVIKVDASNLPTLAFGNYAHVKQGEFVLAFGTPEGLENTVTMGVVSSALRQLNPDSSMVYIQTDAAINPGNSGGPLVDVDGNLVGINTAIFSESGGSEGIGFAIPSLIVRSVYNQIRRFGHVHRYEIGAHLQTITPTLAAGLQLPRDHGVIVADVDPDGPAKAKGLQVNDIVIRLNGSSIESLPMYAASLYLRNQGEAVRLEVSRGAETVKLTIPVVEKDENFDSVISSMDPEKSLISRLGILGIEIDSKIASAFPDLRIKSGIVVAAKSNGPTVDTGIETGDVIHKLNATDIASLGGLRQLLDSFKPGDPVVVQVERSGGLRYLAFDWE